MSLFREPDAGNLPVRFDEREQETGPSQTGLRRRGESQSNTHRETTVTAPVLDSTCHLGRDPAPLPAEGGSPVVFHAAVVEPTPGERQRAV